MYDVESILAHKKSGRKNEILYLVRWSGYRADEDTWEPLCHFQDCPELIQEYWAKQLNIIPQPPVIVNNISQSNEEPAGELLDVEYIMAHQIMGLQNEIHYLVRWKSYGPDKDTWEPLDSFQDCLELIQEYWAKTESTRPQ